MLEVDSRFFGWFYVEVGDQGPSYFIKEGSPKFWKVCPLRAMRTSQDYISKIVFNNEYLNNYSDGRIHDFHEKTILFDASSSDIRHLPTALHSC